MRYAASSASPNWNENASTHSDDNEPFSNEKYTDIFNSVLRDSEVIKEAMDAWAKDVKEEAQWATDAAQRGDWDTVAEIAKGHGRLIMVGTAVVVVPLVMVLRFPGAVAIALRFGASASLGVVRLLLSHPAGGTGAISAVATILWPRIVAMSVAQKVAM
jgi:hypothetical protein